MVIYDSCAIYIKSATTTKERIVKIDAVISMLLDTALSSAESADMEEYALDDGQTKIRSVYSSPDAVFKAIKSFEKLKTYYFNQLNGRVARLVPSSSIKYGRG